MGDVTIDTESLLALTHQLAAALRTAIHTLETLPEEAAEVTARIDFGPLDDAWDKYNDLLGGDRA